MKRPLLNGHCYTLQKNNLARGQCGVKKIKYQIIGTLNFLTKNKSICIKAFCVYLLKV
jgi:hypothetical protein